jgi:lipid-A-disaccharide synthase-like uncharacterized protein
MANLQLLSKNFLKQKLIFLLIGFFVAIFFPLRARVTKQRTGLIITGIWFVSLLVSIPFLIYRKHYEIQVRIFHNCKQNIQTNK